MIIWINGAFGSGKSTTAESLHLRISNSHIYDPEQVGYFLWDSFPEGMKNKGDFQNINIWRSINYEIIKHIYDNYNGTLIIPMTIVNLEYYNDIIGKLIKDGIEIRVFVLMARKNTIKQRLLNRGEFPDSWAEKQIDRCLDYFERIIKGTKIYTDNLSVRTLTDFIIDTINS